MQKITKLVIKKQIVVFKTFLRRIKIFHILYYKLKYFFVKS